MKNGGGLFVAVCPWGWAQTKKTHDFNQMLTYRTFLEAGIALTENVIWDSSTFSLSKTTYTSHLGIQLDIALAP